MATKRILVATDLSPDSEACWASVCALAKACSAEVFLMRAVVEPEYSPAFDLVAMPALREFDRLRAHGLEAGINVSEDFCIASGNPAEAILRVAGKREVDLIVVGAHTGLGFTAEQVLGNATRPVWFVRPGDDKPPRSIICATDDGVAGLRALEKAVWLAETFGVKLTVLRVAEGEDAGSDRLAELSADTKKRVEGFSTTVQVEVEVRAGTLGGCLVEVIRQSGADLLVMGSAGRKGIERLRQPNRSEWALRHAPASLFVVKR
jgi:nucleotide-binding universal stress UspA family protein